LIEPIACVSGRALALGGPRQPDPSDRLSNRAGGEAAPWRDLFTGALLPRPSVERGALQHVRIRRTGPRARAFPRSSMPHRPFLASTAWHHRQPMTVKDRQPADFDRHQDGVTAERRVTRGADPSLAGRACPARIDHATGSGAGGIAPVSAARPEG